MQAMNSPPTHYLRIRKSLPERFGQSCRIVARGKGPGPRNIAVAFLDGLIVVTHRHAVRRLISVELAD
jgi:hypothetical protein